MSEVDGLLRAEGRYATGAARVPWLHLLALMGIGSFVYGAAMGSFGLRALQAVYSATKVPLLLAVSTLFCLPNFYVVNSVLGLRDDFASACRGVIAAQATVGIALAALAPVIGFVYASSGDYRFVVVMNGVLFAVATFAGQQTLNVHYRALIARNPLHRLGRLAWASLYVFVAIQAAWVLRPFIGAPQMASQFLREDPWSNAYVQVFNDVWVLVREALGLGR